ncbi:MAG: cytochrome c biogenesis protein CcsA [Pseudomonadales bacterium]
MAWNLTAGAGIAAAILYMVGEALLIRGLRRGVPLRRGPLIAVGLPAVLLDALCTSAQMQPPEGWYLGFYTALSLVTLVMVLFVLVTSLRLPVQNLLLLAFPLAALTSLGSLHGETGFEARVKLSPQLIGHIVLSITAYSILFMAACQSILVAIQERALRRRRPLGVLRLLPPLESMESVLFALLWVGIVTLTLSIGSGFLFLEDLFGQRVVHHTVLSCASWLLYAVLLIGRHRFGWRSSTATSWTLIAFSLLVLGYFGSKFVLEILLDSGAPAS